MLVDGSWDPDATLERDEDGTFVRQQTTFRDRVSSDPSAPHPVESGRYHLYASYACPWAHRTLIGRAVLGLDEHISIDVVNPIRYDQGWTFASDFPGATGDSINDHDFLRDTYRAADPTYTGRVTVPVLWDRDAETIVNNESIDILRQFDTVFADAFDVSSTLYPTELRPEIDETVDAIYEPINNGVYRAGFADSQSAYDAAVDDIFDALDDWNDRLADRRYMLGEQLTEADVCLFTTLLRFDPVYHVHFKCSRRRIVDYHHLWNYLKELAQLPAFRKTIHLDHIRHHYYRSHGSLNPKRIVATPPAIDLFESHDRDRLSGGPPEGALSG